MRLRRLREMLVPGAVVLLYHRVARVEDDPFKLAVTPETFAEHLELIRHHFTPISLRELVVGLRAGSVPRRSAVLTFDDGYADNLYEAKPLLTKYDIPATVYVVAGDPERERVFWWDRFVATVARTGTPPRRVTMPLPGGAVEIDVGGEACWDSDRRPGFERLYLRLRALTRSDREEALARFTDICLSHPVTNSGVDPAGARRLMPDEILALAADGLVEIGAHSTTHPVLSDLTAEDQWGEIEGGKRWLEGVLGRPVDSFAYPFGFPGSFSTSTTALVGRAGYSSAVTTVPGRVGRGTTPLAMPRLQVFGWSTGELEKAIGG